MACSLCRGTLVPIKVPTGETAFQCMVCGTVDTAEQMMARSLRKAIHIASRGAAEEDGKKLKEKEARDAAAREAVEAFLKSLSGKPPGMSQ